MRTLFFVLLFLPRLAPAQEASSAAAASDRLDAVEQRLSALEGAPAKTSLSAFNPAMGMALDMAYEHTDGKGAFLFRSAELNVEAPIDPFLKGWAIITGSNGSPAVDVEEAALETTSLPSLTVRGGRLFASFGRMAHFHDHELPVVDRPKSLDDFIGGETRADGLEAQYLVPAPFYLSATAGAYDKIGANNARTDPAGSRPLEEFTYLGRLSTYADLNADHSVELGIDTAWTPQRRAADGTTNDTWRTLSGVDFTYRYQPVSGGLYNGLLWGAEIMRNDERRFDPATSLPLARQTAYAGYTVLQFKAGLRLRPGVMLDITEDQDDPSIVTRTYAAFLTCDVTEFQRLRIQYSRVHDNLPGVRGSDIIALQWTGVLGHHVHGFRDR